MDDDAQERQLNIHLDPEQMAGVYANFANVTFSPYEFTLTFARIDHEVEEGDVPRQHVGAVLPGAARGDAGLLLEVVDPGRDSQPSRSTAAHRLNH